ncbi:MAG: inorganic pyrophosphatase [Acetobacteraceae bacterium]|uniref:inorganic pyrophosphatase n=1 Tax=Bradyrhizobium sp. TaxID=376 RepID=UPI003D105BC9
MTKKTEFSQWRPHPWHGLETWAGGRGSVLAFIEITPFDTIKYEVDKLSGYLRVDRPQRTSSLPPTLYGFIPRTYCGRRVAGLASSVTEGDGDPLDICVISERPISRSEVIMNVKVIGGMCTIDGGEADDKIIAVLENDCLWESIGDVKNLPSRMVERLRHYFSTYKYDPTKHDHSPVVVESVYGRDHAIKVIDAAVQDYDEIYK